MEHQDSITEVRPSDGNVRTFSYVTPFVLDWSEEGKLESAKRLNDLWQKVSTQHYAFDDYSQGKADTFIQGFVPPYNAFTAHFLVGESGYCVVRNLYKNSVPSIHFVIWDHNLGMLHIKAAAQEIIDVVFENFHCHRIDAYIPSHNKFARRVALMLRFKYEGAKREATRYGGRWHDVEIYGLLNLQQNERVQ